MKKLNLIFLFTLLIVLSLQSTSQILIKITNNSPYEMAYGFTPWDGAVCDDLRYMGVSGGISPGQSITVNAPLAWPSDVLRNVIAYNMELGCLTGWQTFAQDWAGGCGVPNPGTGSCGNWTVHITGSHSFEINP